MAEHSIHIFMEYGHESAKNTSLETPYSEHQQRHWIHIWWMLHH